MDALYHVTDEEITEVVNALSRKGVLEERRKRMRQKTPSMRDTIWGQMLADPHLRDPNSKQARKFRRRFRVPYPLFEEVLVPLCNETNVFEIKKNSIIPVEYRVLVVLRILGRGHSADDCIQLCPIGESTCYALMHR